MVTDPKDKDALTPEIVETPDKVMVAGHEVKPLWLEGFKLFTEGKKIREIAKQLGLAEITVQKWKRTPWWKEWIQLYFDDANEDLRANIISKDGKLVEYYGDLLDGKKAEDKSAGAVVKAMGLRYELGANPLINRKGSLHVDTMINNTQNIIVNKETTKNLTQSDLLKIITGEMPVPESVGSDGS